MKVTVIGSHLCPDTLYALNRLSEVKAEIEFKNLSSICRRAARVPRVVPSWVSRIAVRDSSSVVMHFAMATAVA